MSDKKGELLTLREHMSSSTPVFGGVSVAHLLSFSSCPIMCPYVRIAMSVTNSANKKMLGLFLPPVVCRRAHVLVCISVFVVYVST